MQNGGKNTCSRFDPSSINRYGFSGGDQTLSSKNVKQVRDREHKWFSMIRNWDSVYVNEYDKLIKRCRKGIPHSLRASAWRSLTGAGDIMENNKGLFDKLASKDSKWANHIDKDLHRTYQMHEMFAEEGGLGQQEMRKLLIAYSEYNPKIGYCQGMSSIAGILLMIMPAEQAFWSFVTIMDKYLLGYYTDGLLALQLDGKVMESLVARIDPNVGKFLKDRGLQASYYSIEWFMCVFTRTLPWDTVLRVWDIFLCEGSNVLINVGVTLIMIAFQSSHVRDACTSFDKAIKFLKYRLPKELLLEDTFIEEYLRIRFNDKDIQEEHIRQLAKLEEILPS